METVILASASPRRSELLSRVGIPFRTVHPDLDESDLLRGAGPEIVTAISIKKVEAATKKVESAAGRFKGESPKWIIGADTVVEIDGRLLGKPAGNEEAGEFLRLLSGKVHRVHTGLALLPDPGKRIAVRSCTTEVKFQDFSASELDFYLRSGEWSGAAGAYRIQERGGLFVQWVRGSYSNVVGLPLETLYLMLKDAGYVFEYQDSIPR